ncbi:YfhO family protein [Secundilactobacillus folii]|uniref:YfhO family protein n=1 Tax=Secundilactobacillus folii TaxID=2678357 RepID=A0A7X3C2Z0_9LACO|nr:YfhO family protein [Secundilactobacillus folii]MTV83325.1 YfhO family protein [Secundilactobacillus folii]
MKRDTYRLPVWLTYTLAFLIIVMLTFGALHATGRTTIWSLDGIAQHYPILKEFYRILHGTAHQSLFSWSWNLGLGANQMTTFAYYVVGDPFSYLIGLFPADQIELGYTLLTILRLYCVGLSFLVLAKRFHFKRGGMVFGALIYTFNGFAFYVSYHHPFFLLPMIFFPLLCLTIDRVLQGKSWWWFAIVTAAILICNVYFAYLLAFGAVLFLIIRYADLKHKSVSMPKLWQIFSRLLVAIVLSILIAAVILLPNVLAMMHSSRMGGSIFANNLLVYPEVYYRTLPDSLLTSNGTIYYWGLIATSGLTLIAMVWMFRRFKRYLALNITMILIGIGLIFPAVAATLNVMSTPSNRWLMLAQLAFALVAATLIDHLDSYTARDFALLSGIVGLLIIAIWFANGDLFKFRQIQLLTYFVFMLFVWLISLFLLRPQLVRPLKLGLLGLVMLNAVTTGLSFYSDNYSGAPANELPVKTASEWSKWYFDGADQYLHRTDNSFYRTSTTNDYYTMMTVGNNIPMLLNTHTISSYYSVQNGNVNQFNQQLANFQNSMNNPTSGVDTRGSMLSLLNVKYLFARQDDILNKRAVPYGFSPLKTKSGQPVVINDHPVYSVGNGTGTVILKNRYALPLVYTQNTQISANVFNKLTSLQRQEALLEGAKVEHSISGIKATQLKIPTKHAAYTVQLTSLPILKITDMINYRLQHNTKQSLSAAVTKGPLSPKEAMTYAAATGLDQPSESDNKLLSDNQTIIDNNAETNVNGLHEMTSDILGQPQSYSLKLKQPKQYQGTELYLDLSGISSSFPDTAKRLNYFATQAKMAGTPLPSGQQRNNWRTIINTPLFNAYTLTVGTNRGKTTFNQLGINNLSDYEPKHHLLINLGYSNQLRKTINLSFTGAERINFKHVKVIAVPYGANYRQATTKLQKTGLSNQQVTNNRVSGRSTGTSKRILTTSIPYSSGWQLTVDGKKTATQVVNSGFVGAVLPAGRHQIVLKYRTPGLQTGLWLTIAGIILAACAGGWQLLRYRRLKAQSVKIING